MAYLNAVAPIALAAGPAAPVVIAITALGEAALGFYSLLGAFKRQPHPILSGYMALDSMPMPIADRWALINKAVAELQPEVDRLLATSKGFSLFYAASVNDDLDVLKRERDRLSLQFQVFQQLTAQAAAAAVPKKASAPKMPVTLLPVDSVPDPDNPAQMELGPGGIPTLVVNVEERLRHDLNLLWLLLVFLIVYLAMRRK